MTHGSEGRAPSQEDVVRLLNRIEAMYRLGGPGTPQGLDLAEPATWHGQALGELDDIANMDRGAWSEAAARCGLDTAAGVRALVRLSAACAAAASLRYALGAVEPATGEPAAPEAVLDEIAVTQWWLPGHGHPF
jgi:hypothetical protein